MTQYRKGASLENLVKDILNNDGWFAIRSAGSHSLIDVMADKYGEVWFIQCRTNGKLSGNERVELITLAEKHKATPILAYKNKGNIVFEEIKSKIPTFHFEVVEGRFIKVGD